MNGSAKNQSLLTHLKLRWYLMLSGILHFWVKARVLPDAEGETGVKAGRSVCYVMDEYALSSVLILDRTCHELGLSRPLYALTGLDDSEKRAYAVLKRMKGLFIRRPSTRRSSGVLRRLVERSYEDPETDILLVPVTVQVGRAPDKETGLAKILFTEDWEVAGRFRRLVSTLINGRDTVVQFARPVSLRELADENLGAARSLRKVSRVLRVHFRRVKSSMIGPDLSHRRTMVDSVVNTPAVRQAVADKVRREGISEEKARRTARKYAQEITANYSYSFVRTASLLVTWFTEKIYSGLNLHNFDRFKRQALDFEIIYVPCHRSHVDYLLVSYLLYMNGFVPPHVAAGVNLNLPVVGSWLRRGGAFYLRRTFRSKKLYSAVFNEYVSLILSRGVSIEYFIEGTRSRTGRLLPPKSGMLAMTIRGYLRSPVRSIMFQPVYIGYEQMVEGSSYTRELLGSTKKSESLRDLFKVFHVLKKKYGNANVSFGQPIFLDQLLEKHDPDWRETTAGPDAKPGWMISLVNELGDNIMTGINAAADVNPVNLLAMIMLATPKHALGEQELLDQIQLYRSLLQGGPLGDEITITGLDPEEIVSHGIDLGLLQRTPHKLGDIITLEAGHAVGLTYFRNNVAHLFAIPSLIGCCFLRQRHLENTQLMRIASVVYPFLKAELFLPWDAHDIPNIVQSSLRLLESHGLLSINGDGEMLERAAGGSSQAWQMTLLARGMLQTLERYFITLAVLVKNGSGTLSRPQLERLCILTAQRISRIHEFEAPEFYDRSLFKQFIGQLRKLGILVNNDDARLEFDDRLVAIVEDARFILEKEIRHGIIRVAPQALTE